MIFETIYYDKQTELLNLNLINMKKSILFGVLAFFAISAMGIQDATAQNDDTKNQNSGTTLVNPKKAKPAPTNVDQAPGTDKTNGCCDKKNCGSKKVNPDPKAAKSATNDPNGKVKKATKEPTPERAAKSATNDPNGKVKKATKEPTPEKAAKSATNDPNGKVKKATKEPTPEKAPLNPTSKKNPKQKKSTNASKAEK